MKPIAIIAILAVPLLGQTGTEQFAYTATWRLFDAGRAVIRVTGHETTVDVATQGIVGKLHPVKDRYQSTLRDGYCAQSSLMKAEEGDEQTETAVSFDQGIARRIHTDFKQNRKETSEIAIPACTHDLVGGLMKMRELRLRPGAEARVPLSDGRKMVQTRVLADRLETITTNAGTFKAIRYEVFLYNGVFFRKKGHLFVWITDDERRLPVQMKVELAFYIGDIVVSLDALPAATNEQAILAR